MPMHTYPAPTRTAPIPQILVIDTAHGRAAVTVVRARFPRGYGCAWRVEWEAGGARTGLNLSVEGTHEALESALTAGPVVDHVSPSC